MTTESATQIPRFPDIYGFATDSTANCSVVYNWSYDTV